MKDCFKNFDYSKFTISELVNAYRNFLAEAVSLKSLREDSSPILAMYNFTVDQLEKIIQEFHIRMNIFE